MFRTSQVHPQERLLQAVCADLVCGNKRTTRYVQPLIAGRIEVEVQKYDIQILQFDFHPVSVVGRLVQK
jgi:hypothetical protein